MVLKRIARSGAGLHSLLAVLGTNREGEPLVIALGVTGGMAPTEETDGSVLLTSGRGAILRYGGLRAVDAGGRVLPSRMEVRGREIRLIVQDRMPSIRWLWTRPGRSNRS